ncbi:hypothetical protein C9426_24065 [Serratia sp. S1B]|nr:hypothetical protein C9426_24065 [Serratia sp. S1B]
MLSDFIINTVAGVAIVCLSLAPIVIFLMTRSRRLLILCLLYLVFFPFLLACMRDKWNVDVTQTLNWIIFISGGLGIIGMVTKKDLFRQILFKAKFWR